jgi:hypothetical protein
MKVRLESFFKTLTKGNVMPYQLSFTEEFFMGAATLEPPVKDKPKSVYEALEVMPEDEWEEMCNHLFPKVHYEIIDIEDVMDLIKATDTCSNLDSPVEVWVDEDGDFKINVHFMKCMNAYPSTCGVNFS